jgi:CheY-like chemotaxis protein
VLTAQGPIRALFLATTNGEFDFAIVDYEMPMMNGTVLAQHERIHGSTPTFERITPRAIGLETASRN